MSHPGCNTTDQSEPLDVDDVRSCSGAILANARVPKCPLEQPGRQLVFIDVVMRAEREGVRRRDFFLVTRQQDNRQATRNTQQKLAPEAIGQVPVKQRAIENLFMHQRLGGFDRRNDGDLGDLQFLEHMPDDVLVPRFIFDNQNREFVECFQNPKPYLPICFIRELRVPDISCRINVRLSVNRSAKTGTHPSRVAASSKSIYTLDIPPSKPCTARFIRARDITRRRHLGGPCMAIHQGSTRDQARKCPE